MQVGLSRLHFPVTVLGPGKRAGIWFQGCSIQCGGCVARDTWSEPSDDAMVPVDAVVRWCERFADAIEGITISGGEPFDQPDALLAMLEGFASHAELSTADILVYTGYSLDDARSRARSALDIVDAIVTQPYDVRRPTTLRWRGSENQRLIPLTPRGHLRFSRYTDARTDAEEIQMDVTGGAIWMVGIPRRGMLSRFDRSLSEQGVRLEGRSWRP